MTKCGVLTAVSGLAMASAALGQTWNETGDAGDLPATAQVCEGTGPLTSISGNHATDDVDMYKIKIADEANFRATTVGGATWDTQLWVFDATTSRGVVFNDDSTGLQSTLTSLHIPANGEYYIAISRYNRDCNNSANALIWLNSPFSGERVPDGPGAGDPVPASWTGTTTAGGAYQILLSGCEFVSEACYPDCDTSTGVGVLDVFDFLCFQNRYDAGSSYACDCDTSTGVGMCDVFDFLCFQNAYDQGCP